MTRREQHENDHRFAPVLRDDDESLATDDDRAGGREVSGTGVVDESPRHPESLPPTPAGAREAERADDTGDDGWEGRPGRPGNVHD